MPSEVGRGLMHHLGVSKIYRSGFVGGGCIHQAQFAETDRGKFFIKSNYLSAKDMFETEVFGLEYLKTNGKISVPEVLAQWQTQDRAFLVLDFLEQSPPDHNTWSNFGSQLANLHRVSHTFFGFEKDNFIGSLPQINTLKSSWVDFFISNRVEPLLKKAIDQKRCEASLSNRFQSLFLKLDSIFPKEPPALIHGDLWSGNVMRCKRGIAYFDPAIYYGHREIELAFTHLFGGFPMSFYDGYERKYPLTAGFMGRKDIYNLYPLLVHVILFGEGYLSGIKATLNQFK